MKNNKSKKEGLVIRFNFQGATMKAILYNGELAQSL